VTSRRVTGLPRPLPECRRCKAPMPRTVWRTRRVCAACATPAERMAAVQTAAELERKATATTRAADARIDALAARRAARASRAP
jgi:hypothetical protein